MTSLFTRRLFLKRAPLAAAAVALPAAVAVGAFDPLAALIDRHVALWEACPDDAAGQAAWNRSVDAPAEEMGRTAPTTKQGVIAGLRHVEWFSDRWGTTDNELRILRNCIDFLAGEA